MNRVSDIYTQGSRLEASLTELYNRETELGEALNKDADAEYAFKIKQAEEFELADGGAESRKMQSLLKCKAEYKAHLKAKAVKEFIKVKVADSQNALSARQTLLTNSVKSDLGYANDKRVT